MDADPFSEQREKRRFGCTKVWLVILRNHRQFFQSFFFFPPFLSLDTEMRKDGRRQEEGNYMPRVGMAWRSGAQQPPLYTLLPADQLSSLGVELKRVSKKWSPILGTSVRTHLKRLKSILQSHPLYSRHPPSPNLLLFLLLTTTLRRFVACDFSLRPTCHQSVSSGTTHKVKFPRCVSFFTLQLN